MDKENPNNILFYRKHIRTKETPMLKLIGAAILAVIRHQCEGPTEIGICH
jgi:hypothetical protein